MLSTGHKAVRDRDGKIVQAAPFQGGEAEAEPGRVQPDRRWFGERPLRLSRWKLCICAFGSPLLSTCTPATGNTRVISQTALDHFRESLAKKKADPYSVVLKQNKLPMSLLHEASKVNASPSFFFDPSRSV
jgi:nuclear GTP-binding protein